MLIPFKDLWKRHQIECGGVLHLGASEGQEAEAYTEQGVARVIWVEALPDVFAKLKRHLLNYPTHEAIQACISDDDYLPVPFHVANNQGQSSSLFRFGTHAVDHPTVKFVNTVQMTTRRVDTLLAEHNLQIGPDPDWFLNIDLQGAELMALRGMGQLLHQFKYAYIEVNNKEVYKGCPLVGEIDAYLAGYGLKSAETKWTGAGWGDRFYIKGIE